MDNGENLDKVIKKYIDWGLLMCPDFVEVLVQILQEEYGYELVDRKEGKVRK